jgi:hypothetical protein
MFICNHCHTEYGGIRGVKGAVCPRCVARESFANSPRPVATTATATPSAWHSPQLALASWSPSSYR